MLLDAFIIWIVLDLLTKSFQSPPIKFKSSRVIVPVELLPTTKISDVLFVKSTSIEYFVLTFEFKLKKLYS